MQQITGLEGEFEQLAAAAAEALPDPVVWLDDQLRAVWANAAAEAVFGWDRETILTDLDLVSLVHPDDLNEALAAASTVTGKAVGTLIEVRLRAADGTWRRTEIRGRATRTGGGEGLLLVVRDVSDRYGWHVAGSDEQLLRTVVEAASTPVLVCNPDGSIRGSSGALTRTLGLDREEVQGRHLATLAVDADLAAVRDVLADVGDRRRSVDVRLLDASGFAHPFRLEVSDLRDDPAVGGFVVFAHDIGDLQAALSNLQRVADTDALTGLVNRPALMAELRARLARPAGRVAVLFCDLDGFKAVNDLFGHSRGDELLCEVAERLRASVRPVDVVARLGGDEFVVVSEARTLGELRSLSARVERAVSGPKLATGHQPGITASVGAVLIEAGSCTAEDALAEADAAMYRAKLGRRGLQVVDGTVAERRILARELAAGFDRGQVEAYFQPIVSLADRSVYGFETLVRWQHPTRGLLGPAEFLEVCEEAGLQGRLAAVTIQGAAELLASTAEHVGVSVNLSPLQLAERSTTAELLEALAVTGTDPVRLAVEVTERSVLDLRTSDGRRVPEVLADMRASGIRVAVDDFGTGSASLARLVEMPACILKVDRSFVAGLGVDPVASALVRSVVALAVELGLAVVAEGVETVEQERALAEMGCSFAQGWLYSKAVPFEEAVSLAALRSIDPVPVS